MPSAQQSVTRAESGLRLREGRSGKKDPAYEARRLIAAKARELLVERPLWLQKLSRIVPPS